MSPQRIQRKRTKGYRLPEGAVYVGRPTKWGNPFEAYLCPCCKAWDVRDNNGVTYLANHEFIRLHPRMTIGKAEAVARAVELYGNDFRLGTSDITPEEVRAELAGKDLACWCPLSSPCHADVLLELANAGEPS
jgi:hypothetical protein